MALGFCPAVLEHLKRIAGSAYPGDKVTQQGFLLYLLNVPQRPSIIESEGFRNGHRKTVNVKYKPRGVENHVNDAISCDIDLTPAWKETSTAINNVVQLGIWFDDETIRQYCDDATRMVSAGTPPTMMMAEVLEGILSQMNGIYAKMERVLTTSMSTKFGRNKVSNQTATTLNIPLTGTSNNLNEGYTKFITDLASNEICNNVNVVGNGLFYAAHVQRMANAISANQSGLNTANLSSLGYDQFWLSNMTASTWGSNYIGVFEAGSAHLLQYNRNVGPAFTGPKGTSFFSSIFDPRVQCWTPGGYQNLRFDLQMKYLDCPGNTLNNGYTGSAGSYDRGWAIYISTTYDLFVTPKDAYDGNDVLQDGNGTLEYVITNT